MRIGSTRSMPPARASCGRGGFPRCRSRSRGGNRPAALITWLIGVTTPRPASVTEQVAGGRRRRRRCDSSQSAHEYIRVVDQRPVAEERAQIHDFRSACDNSSSIGVVCREELGLGRAGVPSSTYVPRSTCSCNVGCFRRSRCGPAPSCRPAAARGFAPQDKVDAVAQRPAAR